MEQRTDTPASHHDAGNAAFPQTEATRPLRVLHVMSVSLPHLNGYALRGRYLVEAQAQSGTVEPLVVTSPFYPGLEASRHEAVINGIPYYRIHSPRSQSVLGFVLRIASWLYWQRKRIRFQRRRILRWTLSQLVRARHMARRSQYHGRRFRFWVLARFARVRRIVRRARYYSRRFRYLALSRFARGRRIVRRARHHSRRFRYWVLSRFARGHDIVMRIRYHSRRFRIPDLSPFWRLFTRTDQPTRGTSQTRSHRHWARFLASINDSGLLTILRTVCGIPQRIVFKLLGFLDIASKRARSTFSRVDIAAWCREAEHDFTLRKFHKELVRLCQKTSPDVIHVHSPYFCAIPAVKCGAQLEIPVVYEVRGIWEESGVAQGNFQRTSKKYQDWRRRETWAMQQADAVICICEQLRRDVVSRGVPAERVFLSPNAVDVVQFAPGRADTPLPETPQLAREVRAHLRGQTIGYIGSIRKLEGVDELVRGVAEVVHRGYDASLLVVGGGPGLDELRKLADELGIGERAIFTDRVPHEDIAFYYELIDIFVISRPPSRVAKLVTPLKPLEAMAMQKALVVSKLPALCELVHDGVTGLTYLPSDVSDLADKCGSLIDSRQLSQQLARGARDWVVSERTWNHSINGARKAYESVLESTPCGEIKIEHNSNRAA